MQILTDNISCVAYINPLGGPSAELTHLAQSLWAEAYKLNIRLSAKYLAGKLNVKADWLSRKVSPLEWRLHPSLFKHIDNTFRPHTIDIFASLCTTQLPRYNAQYWNPATEAVDATAQHWGEDTNFTNAPFLMIQRILDKIQSEGAEATIISPW